MIAMNTRLKTGNLKMYTKKAIFDKLGDKFPSSTVIKSTIKSLKSLRKLKNTSYQVRETKICSKS